MSKVINTGTHEIEASFVIENKAFRATVMVRSLSAKGLRGVGYMFEQPHDTAETAMATAERMAEITARTPDLLVSSAEWHFSLTQ